MFFPERIKRIAQDDWVLEVGPGNTPFYRSDVLLEKIFQNEAEAYEQSGRTKNKNLKKKIIYYEEEKFPFKDNEFDYLICSHVLEHIQKKDLDTFISELNRISNRGYIEVPLYTFELITNIDVHLSLIYIDEKNLINFLFKEDLNLNVFGNGFEYDTKIDYIIHSDIDSFFDLVKNESMLSGLRWNKNISYYKEKFTKLFNRNLLKQKIYNKFKIVFK